MSDPDHTASWTLPEALTWGQERDPPEAFRDFLLTLHGLCHSGRVHATGCRRASQPRDAVVPIPAADWMGLNFDSDGEKLRSGDLFSARLPGRVWTSVRFSRADLIREWPRTGAAAFATKYWTDRFCGRRERTIRERWRREWIDRFAAKQGAVAICVGICLALSLVERGYWIRRQGQSGYR